MLFWSTHPSPQQPPAVATVRPTLEEALGDVVESGLGELDPSFAEEPDLVHRRMPPELSHPLGW